MTNLTELSVPDLFKTKRLKLNVLSKSDALFIKELTNTDGWLKFIGTRDTSTISKAVSYIEKIDKNPNTKFWKASLAQDGTAIGVISLIKRDYLNHMDIGFAFLPQFAKKGYATEASKTVLDWLKNQSTIQNIYATTIVENINSINLLNRLGFSKKSTIKVGEEYLELYAMLIIK